MAGLYSPISVPFFGNNNLNACVACLMTGGKHPSLSVSMTPKMTRRLWAD